ncbi:MAG: carboxypeptidase-like regulatory domain-containing protein [Saprospiraceae bacterium]|jgi:hypothetical protein|nr:carboxypeptidase-like regulatory domain-containing protein [Saprospiraceae bacterium]
MAKRIILLILLITSCYKDNFHEETTISPNNPKINLWKKIYGQILNTNNEPIRFANIKFKSKTFQTDENGNFSFTDYISEDRSILIVTHPDYIDGIISVKAYKDGDQRIITKLNFKNNFYTYFSEDKITIHPNNGSLIHFDENSFANEDSSIYSGAVNIHFKLCDQTNDILNNLPNDKTSIKDKKDKLILGDMPYLFLEVTNKNGLPLKLVKPAHIEIQIPNNLQNLSPYILDTWYLDKLDGIWKNGSKAVKKINSYQAEINQLGYIKIDNARPYAIINGQFSGITNLPYLILYLTTSNSSYQLQLNDAGYYSMKIPINEPFYLLLENKFKETLFSKSFSSLNEDVTLPEFNLSVSHSVPIKAKIADCNGAFSENNWIILREIGKVNDYIMRPESSGDINEIVKSEFTGDYVLFSSSIMQTAINKANPIFFKVAETINLTNIMTCQTKDGQTEMKLSNNQGYSQGSHFFPNNAYYYIGPDKNNGLIDVDWIDTYSPFDEVTYSLTIQLKNGEGSILNNEIRANSKGNPPIYFKFGAIEKAQIKIYDRPQFLNSIIIDINNINATDQNGKYYNINVTGIYLK